MNEAALQAYGRYSGAAGTAGKYLGNLSTGLNALETWKNYQSGDVAGAWVSGLGSVISASAYTPLGAAVSLGYGLGSGIGAQVLTSTDWGNNLVNNLSDYPLNLKDTLVSAAANYNGTSFGSYTDTVSADGTHIGYNDSLPRNTGSGNGWVGSNLNMSLGSGYLNGSYQSSQSVKGYGSGVVDPNFNTNGGLDYANSIQDYNGGASLDLSSSYSTNSNNYYDTGNSVDTYQSEYENPSY